MIKVIQKFLLLSISFILFISVSTAQSKIKIKETYSYCEGEYDRCIQKCTVHLVSGSKIALGSYVKVYLGKDLITEGYILKHVSGSIFILKDKKDAKDPEVCGGCCGGAYSIIISKKQIWGC
ncbi:MAG: hypothetical protein ACK5XN_31505 [Bacteroidota bacterium]